MSRGKKQLRFTGTRAATAIAVTATAVTFASFNGQRAYAQGGLNVNLTEFGDRDEDALRDLQNNPVGAGDCDGTFTVRVTGIPTDRTQLDVWRGSSCQTPENRTPNTGSCEYLEPASLSLNGGQSEANVTLSVSDLIENCSEEGADNTIEIFLLATRSSGSTDDVQNAFGNLTIRHDTQPPNAPSNLKGGSGNTSIPISWDGSSDPTLDDYQLYLEAGLEAGCGNTQLIEGEAGLEELLLRNVSRESGNATINASDADLSPGDYAAVALAAVDRAGNISPLSAVACIEVVETEGFWARYFASGGEANEGSGCRVAAGYDGRSSGSRSSALLVLASLLAWSVSAAARNRRLASRRQRRTV